MFIYCNLFFDLAICRLVLFFLLLVVNSFFFKQTYLGIYFIVYIFFLKCSDFFFIWLYRVSKSFPLFYVPFLLLCFVLLQRTLIIFILTLIFVLYTVIFFIIQVFLCLYLKLKRFSYIEPSIFNYSYHMLCF